MDTSGKMYLFGITLICTFVQITSQNPLSVWTLEPNVLVVEVNGTQSQHPISCLHSQEELMRRGDGGGDLFWKKNGVEQAGRTGNTYQVRLEESLGGGNYTCHNRDGTLVNHTVILIQELPTQKRKILEKSDSEDYLKCTAQNYSGGFHCSWTWHDGRVSRLALVRAYRNSKAPCSTDVGGPRWDCPSQEKMFQCTVDDGGRGVTCVDPQHCPFAEEIEHIHVDVYFTTSHFLLEVYSKNFYLSQIVKPDRVNISEVDETTVSWSYPSSWSSPSSYFPLTFQIKELKCGKCDNPCDHRRATRNLMHSSEVCHFKVMPRTRVVCVRARDAVCNSQWSEWSQCRLTRNENASQQHSRERV